MVLGLGNEQIFLELNYGEDRYKDMKQPQRGKSVVIEQKEGGRELRKVDSDA